MTEVFRKRILIAIAATIAAALITLLVIFSASASSSDTLATNTPATTQSAPSLVRAVATAPAAPSATAADTDTDTDTDTGTGTGTGTGTDYVEDEIEPEEADWVEPEPAAEPEPEPASEPAPAPEPVDNGPFMLYVAGSGGQAEIDACIGAIDYLGLGVHFAEHSYCGGDRYHSLGIGDLVQLTGSQSGLYEVISIYDSWAGTKDYIQGGTHLQTSLGGGAVRLWQLAYV